MNKKSLFLLYFFCLSFIAISAQNYHRLETYPTNDLMAACNGTSNQKFVVKVNININYLLDVNKFYEIDLGNNFNLGVRYCKVLNRSTGNGDADFNIESTDIVSQIDVCNFYRYHRFETFTTLEKAKQNICGQTTAHDGKWKANIKITQLLDVGKLYQINLGNGLGTRYCKILNRYDGRGDADFDINNLTTVPSAIVIDCSPDLEAIQASVSSVTINHGENKTVSYSVKNIADIVANSVQCKFYLAKNNSLISTLKTLSIGSVNANQTKTGSTMVTIPLGTSTDTYKIAMKVSTSGESNLSNNTVYSSSSFMVNGVQYTNLLMSSLKIAKQNGSQGNVIFDYPNGNVNTPTLNKGNWYDFTIGVKNEGPNTAPSVSLDIIFTNNTSNEFPHPSVPFYGVATDGNIGDINANQVIEKTFSVFVDNNIGSSPNLSNNSIYRLFFPVDINDDNDNETNEDDNIKFLQFVYSSSSTSKSNFKLKQPHPTLEEILKPYSIDIYNFQQQKVLSKEVTSKEEENKLIQSLNSGLYIVKSKNKTYKIFIE